VTKIASRPAVASASCRCCSTTPTISIHSGSLPRSRTSSRPPTAPPLGNALRAITSSTIITTRSGALSASVNARPSMSRVRIVSK
jgi:hypothetical protein